MPTRAALRPKLAAIYATRAADDEASQGLPGGSPVVWHREVRARGIVRIVASNDAEPQRGIFDGLAEDTDVVERGRKRYESEPAHAAIGRLDSYNSAEGRGLPDRTAGLRTKGDADDASSDGGR